ncbi:MAG: hypothetical protein V4510_04840 [bacterium]
MTDALESEATPASGFGTTIQTGDACEGPTPLDLMQGLPYVRHEANAGGATIHLLFRGIERSVTGGSLRLSGQLAPGSRVAVLAVQRELLAVVLE